VDIQTELDATIRFADDERPVSLGVVLYIGSFHDIDALRDNRAVRNSIMSSRGEGLGGGGKVKTGTEDASRLIERTRSILDVSAVAI
jgi:hypothetical protein